LTAHKTLSVQYN